MQKELLSFVNSSFGREYLDISHSHKAVMVTPNAIHYYLGNDTYLAEFKTWNYIDYLVTPYLEIAKFEKPELLNNFHHLINSIHLTISTFNPNADGSGTGRLQSTNAAFATARSGSGLTKVDSIAQLQNTLSGNYTLDRDFAPFVTSSLPDTAVISAATMSITGSAGSSSTDSYALIVAQSTQASFTSLATSDWGNVGSTSFGSITEASWNGSGANVITLNASGIANISLTGTSGFALIGNRDFNNAAPTGTNIIGISSSSTMVLSVTYTASGFFPFF